MTCTNCNKLICFINLNYYCIICSMTELYYEQMPDNLTPGDIAAYQQILVEDTRRIEGMDGEAAVYGNRFNAEQYINNRPSKTAIFMAINKAKGTPVGVLRGGPRKSGDSVDTEGSLVNNTKRVLDKFHIPYTKTAEIFALGVADEVHEDERVAVAQGLITAFSQYAYKNLHLRNIGVRVHDGDALLDEAFDSLWVHGPYVRTNDVQIQLSKDTPVYLGSYRQGDIERIKDIDLT